MFACVIFLSVSCLIVSLMIQEYLLDSIDLMLEQKQELFLYTMPNFECTLDLRDHTFFSYAENII